MADPGAAGLQLPAAPANPTAQDFAAAAALLGELLRNRADAQMPAMMNQALQQAAAATQGAQAAAQQAAAAAQGAQAAAQQAAAAAQGAQAAAQRAEAAAQGAQEATEGLQAAVQGLQAAVHGLRQDVNTIMHRTSPVLRLALQHNGRSLQPEQGLVRMPHPDTGALPPNFPATNNALEEMSSQELQALLQFYGQPFDGNKLTKRNRIKAFIGQ